MTVLRWGEFGDVVVHTFAQVQPGENLLILADTWTPMEIAEACLVSGINARARAQLLVIQMMSVADPRDLSRVAAGAIRGADVVVGLCETRFAQKPATREAREQGTRVVGTELHGQEDFIFDGVVNVDQAAMVRAAETLGEVWERTEICTVTSPLGTDFSFRMKDRRAFVCSGMATKPGELDIFPGVAVDIAPVEETLDGTVVVDGSVEGQGLVTEPVTLRLEKGVITAIEGGADASAYRSMLESSGDPKAFYISHFTVGLNPRAKMTGILFQDERVWGSVDLGFGSQDPELGGATGAAKIHTDVVLRSPTVHLDGVVMCKNNTFNPDLGLEELE